jgi:hypothetical protein
VKTITREQWERKPADYKGVRRDGTPSWLELDAETGATVSVPVRIAHPMPGDCVILTREWSIVRAGQVAIIEGIVGQPRDEYLINFSYSNFRGPNSRYAQDHTEFVSCSGGPAPYLLASLLQPTGRSRTVTFWRWKDLPCAGGGVNYTLDVPEWEWNGEFPPIVDETNPRGRKVR